MSQRQSLGCRYTRISIEPAVITVDVHIVVEDRMLLPIFLEQPIGIRNTEVFEVQ